MDTVPDTQLNELLRAFEQAKENVSVYMGDSRKDELIEAALNAADVLIEHLLCVSPSR